MDTNEFNSAVISAVARAMLDLLKANVDPASIRIRVVRAKVFPNEPPPKTKYHVVASGSRRAYEQVIADVE